MLTTDNEHLACSLQYAGHQGGLIDDWDEYDNTIKKEYDSKEDQLFDILEHWNYNSNYLDGCIYTAKVLNEKRFDALKMYHQ